MANFLAFSSTLFSTLCQASSDQFRPRPVIQKSQSILGAEACHVELRREAEPSNARERGSSQNGRKYQVRKYDKLVLTYSTSFPSNYQERQPSLCLMTASVDLSKIAIIQILLYHTRATQRKPSCYSFIAALYACVILSVYLSQRRVSASDCQWSRYDSILG